MVTQFEPNWKAEQRRNSKSDVRARLQAEKAVLMISFVAPASSSFLWHFIARVTSQVK